MTVRGITRRAVLAGVPVLAVACAAAPAAGLAAAPPVASAPPAVPDPAAPVAPVPAVEIAHARSGRPEVALTFHGAGDPDLARRVLTGAAQLGAAFTVLAVGTWLAQYPDMARLVLDQGHELGNHTWSHVDLDGLDEAGVRVEIERCRDRIGALTGGSPGYFRPSAAQHATPSVLRLAGAAGYPTVLSYDVDSRDFTDPGAAAIRRNVRAAVAGSVVSLHLGHPGTLQALPGLLADLADRGLAAVTARELLR